MDPVPSARALSHREIYWYSCCGIIACTHRNCGHSHFWTRPFCQFNVNIELKRPGAVPSPTYRVVGNEFLLRLESLVLLQLWVVLAKRFLMQLACLPHDRLQVVMILILGLLCRWYDRIVTVADVSHVLHGQLRNHGCVLGTSRNIDVVVRVTGLLRWWCLLWVLWLWNVVSKIGGRGVSGWINVVHIVRIVAWPWRGWQHISADVSNWERETNFNQIQAETLSWRFDYVHERIGVFNVIVLDLPDGCRFTEWWLWNRWNCARRRNNWSVVSVPVDADSVRQGRQRYYN